MIKLIIAGIWCVHWHFCVNLLHNNMASFFHDYNLFSYGCPNLTRSWCVNLFLACNNIIGVLKIIRLTDD